MSAHRYVSCQCGGYRAIEHCWTCGRSEREHTTTPPSPVCDENEETPNDADA